MKGMSKQEIEERVALIERLGAAKLAEQETQDLIGDFLRLAISEEPDSEMAAKARLILSLVN